MYPEARFVITHRDVTKVIPSVASVETAVVRMMTGSSDPLYIGKHCADTWDISLRRFIAFRDRVGEERFYDIAFEDIQSEPIARDPRSLRLVGRRPHAHHRRRDGSAG